MPYSCASGDDNPAVVLFTNLDAGETVAWCQVCLPMFGEQLWRSLNEEAARLYDAAAEAAHKAEATDGETSKRGRRRPAETPASEPVEPPEDAPTDTPAGDDGGDAGMEPRSLATDDMPMAAMSDVPE